MTVTSALETITPELAAKWHWGHPKTQPVVAEIIEKILAGEFEVWPPMRFVNGTLSDGFRRMAAIHHAKRPVLVSVERETTARKD
jgi:hypothetical protein